jgi:hypothetical protein
MKPSEFQTRIEAQRRVLELVNSCNFSNEQLLGLSAKALGRWTLSNKLPENSPVVESLYNISHKLFFLSTKSQDQISGGYQKVTREVDQMICDLESLLERFTESRKP